jgi:hypothetical protein
MIYVDDAYIPYRRYQMCHLMSDQKVDSDTEIHEFAKRLGLRREWFHGDHYDIAESKRREAVKNGAIEITTKQMVAIRRLKVTP